MSELEKIEQLEKQLKERKRKALAKEYEKIGRAFYKQSYAKSITTAYKMLEQVPPDKHSKPTLTADQFQQLQVINAH